MEEEGGGDGLGCYTTDEALVALGFGKFQGRVLAYAGLGYMAEAMEVMILSFVGAAVRSQWSLSSGQESLLTSVVFVGMLIGAYSWGIISDNYGRRNGLLSVAVVTSTAGFLSIFSFNYNSLLVLRFLVGIGLGGGHVYSSWFLEFVPTPNRGLWMVIFSAFWTVGSMLEAAFAWIVMPTLSWRWLLASSSVPTFMALIFYCFVPESPRHLCVKGRISEAYNILKKIAAVNHTRLPPGRLVLDQMINIDEEAATLTDAHFLSPKGTKSPASKTVFSSFLMLFSSKLIETTALLWVVAFGNAFSYYGIILLTSKLSSQQGKCDPIVVHSEHFTGSGIYRDAFITSCAEFPGIILSALLVDRIGRRTSMAILYAFGFIFLLPLLMHHHEILTTALLFGVRMCTIGAFTISVIYCAEIYPTSVRSTGVGVSNGIGRIGGILCPIVAVQLVDGCRQATAVTLFGAAIVLTGICAVLLPIETKGRALMDNIEVPNSTQESLLN